MKKLKIYFYLAFVVAMFSSCGSLLISNLTSSSMNKLELGMSKEQITKILGNAYTITEKKIENETEIEVLSYRNYTTNDEFYMFILKNGKLERWQRELIPIERKIIRVQTKNE